MTEHCLNIITQITVELHKANTSKEKLGTGVLYANNLLSGMVYVLTAKHCLKDLTEKDEVAIRTFNPSRGTYEYITPANQTILLHSTDDAAIIVINQRELTATNPNLPSVYVVDRNVGLDKAVTKGFPIASLDQNSAAGESSLVTLNMCYRQEMHPEKAFQLTTSDDYNEDTIRGISGAGVFMETCEELYLTGIFTRFTDEDRGKVISAQRLTSFNVYQRTVNQPFFGYFLF